MKLLARALAALLALACAFPAFATEPVTYLGTVVLPTGVTSLGQVQVSAANPLPVNATLSGGGTTTKATAAAPTLVEASTTNPLSVDLAGNLRTIDATAGCTPLGVQSAASTNAANVKASAGTLCGGMAINTTATLYYLRLYNLATSPTCSSATGFVTTIPVPASATGAGTLINLGTFGAAFSTGIAYCITGGGTSTDNTSAAVGVFITLAYK